MTSAEDLLKRIKKWAKEQEEIRAAVLLGSRARRGGTDRLSDIDCALFVTNPQDYYQNGEWFEGFSSVWLSVKENNNALTWKVIYQDGVMAEFMIYSTTALHDMQEELPAMFQPGYKILIDKDRLARKLPKASGKNVPPESPTIDSFHETIERFWLDAYQVAKYLWRHELWRVKHYDWKIKQHLLKMMGWHAVLLHSKSDFTTYQGRHLRDWTEPETHTALMSIFGRFYPADSWRALTETIKIFSRLSGEIAVALNTDDRRELQEKFTGLFQNLQSTPEEH